MIDSSPEPSFSNFDRAESTRLHEKVLPNSDIALVRFIISCEVVVHPAVKHSVTRALKHTIGGVTA